MPAETRKKKKIRRTFITIALVLAIFAIVLAAIWMNMFHYTNPLEDYGVSYPFTENGKTPDKVTFNGLEYQYNTDLVNILFIGYDQTSGRGMQGIGYQADMLMLASVNKKTGDIKIISVPRDTKTEIAIFDYGDSFLTVQAGEPIAKAYAYGRGVGVNGDLTMAAVSNILFRIPIDRYYAMNIDGIVPANDLVGGVNLQLTADFTMNNPEMKVGSSHTLIGEEAMWYVRERQLPGMSGQDADRMKRQNQYIVAFVQTFKSAQKNDPALFFKLFHTMSGYSQTNLNTLEILFLATLLRGTDFESDIFQTIPGQKAGLLYEVDEDRLKQLVLDTFFVEQ